MNFSPEMSGFIPNHLFETNFTIEITGIHHYVDEMSGAIQKKYLDLKFYIISGHERLEYSLHHIYIEDAYDAKIINQIPCAVSFCQNKAEFRGELYMYLNELLLHYRGPIWSIYRRPGWKHNFHDYVTADGAIAHPEQLVRADGNIHIADRFAGGIYPEYLKMLATIKEPGKMQAVLSYVLASFLHSVFEDAGFPVKHALFIVGPRGSKKTSVAQCFTQLGDDRRTVRFNFTAASAVVVKLKEESVENTLLSHFQNRDDIFESFIFRFLKFVGLNYDSTIALIRNTMQYYRNNASVYHFSNARYTDYLAQYMTISHILLGMFLFEGNQIIEKDFIDEFHKNICFLLQENDREMRLQAPVDIVVSAIVYAINNGAVAQWGAPFTKEINFIRGEGAIYFRQMDLLKIVTDYTKKTISQTLL